MCMLMRPVLRAGVLGLLGLRGRSLASSFADLGGYSKYPNGTTETVLLTIS